ncbi:hypothetical protein C5E16_10390 [Clavibacter michiganensis]|uniref:Uncharacterized protein n=1 Tax=Clavibacter michiganensis TaxID=28447 RepID=A0A2S5VSK6_9MICO|nr:hypothetical protein C5E16_10390 [Clavibacter michiganensis]
MTDLLAAAHGATRTRPSAGGSSLRPGPRPLRLPPIGSCRDGAHHPVGSRTDPPEPADDAGPGTP